MSEALQARVEGAVALEMGAPEPSQQGRPCNEQLEHATAPVEYG